MDTAYFLRERTALIRFYFDTAAPAFRRVQEAIEMGRPPFDDPPYSEDGEPAFLDEWLDAQTALQVLGLSCVSLLSDSLKLYFHALQHRVIGFRFDDAETKTFKHGFLTAHLAALGSILETDWTDCPVDFGVIEQVVLARNRGAHGDDLASLTVLHDSRTLQKHPRPFFADKSEWELIGRDLNTLTSLATPSVTITRDNLFAAISEVEALADWIESRIDRAHAWREAQRTKRNTGVQPNGERAD